MVESSRVNWMSFVEEVVVFGILEEKRTLHSPPKYMTTPSLSSVRIANNRLCFILFSILGV